ncbi:hypothetical protein ROJ8625_00694 [Roseivivax jejudonensis]|uniref:Uncharacterized protein n=1 Tax=Roseivivax jejudonensis TaxID=1529041 RepID=A0A1X6YHM7_9RHOB|nr:hypothetical protein [Roseivivax jejudonensis]SLN19882.1 hypothetical protein ROJ8625_00694 [Roseivivax jejudonensis]
MNVLKNAFEIQPKVSRGAMPRRSFLAAIPAAAVAPAVAHAAPRDPHLEWWAEWQRLTKHINTATYITDKAMEPCFERQREIDRLIASTPARTREGVIAQVEWLIEDGRDYWGCDWHRQIAENVLGALRRLA